MESKKTLLLGASMDEARYSNKVAKRLIQKSIEVKLIGTDSGEILTVPILKQVPEGLENIHTVTFYLAPKNQVQYYEIIKKLMPKRVIFNPGAENDDFANQLNQMGISWENSCTLTLLHFNLF